MVGLERIAESGLYLEKV